MKTTELFKEKGFVCLRNLTETAHYYKFMNKLVNLGKGRYDRQVVGSKGFYKEPMFEKLLENLLPDVEKHTGLSLFKTYSYARQYHIGEQLKKHRDRYACEVTVSLCLGNEDKPWPIWIRDREGKNHSFTLEAGDAVIFSGVELIHWREPNSFGACGQTFLHYVDRNGPYQDQRDDMADNDQY